VEDEVHWEENLNIAKWNAKQIHDELEILFAKQ